MLLWQANLLGRKLAVALVATTAITPVVAQAQSTTLNVEITTQPLGSALEALARQSGVDILFTPQSVAGKTVQPLSGTMSVRQALARMLQGTGLTYTQSGSGAITVHSQRGEAGEYGVLVGSVTDAASGTPLNGASVRIAGLTQREATDREGRFIFRRIPAGTYDVSVNYQGKKTATATVNVKGGENSRLPFALVDTAGMAVEAGEIIVTGSPIADAEAAAYQQQKASNNLVNIVASDSIGRFPDQNVAAALSRLPGIAVERDQGQERYVSIRGAPSKWTTLSFNGLNVVSPSGRTPRFDMIPNSIVASIVTTKAITPDMPAESIAGNVNVITQTAFDRPGFNLSSSLGVGFRDLGDQMEYEGSFSISDTFADDKFGFVISGAHYERNQVTDNIESRFEYAKEARDTEGEDLIWTRHTDYRLYHLKRENTAASARLDFRPSDDHRLFVSTIYSEFRDNETKSVMSPDYDDSLACYASVACGNTPVKGTIYGVDLHGSFNRSESIQAISTTTIGGEHYVGGWEIDWSGNYTYSLDRGEKLASAAFVSNDDVSSRSTVEYDYSDPDLPNITLYPTIDNGDGTYSRGANAYEGYPFDTLFYQDGSKGVGRAPTKAWSGRIDFTRELATATPVTLKFGAAFDHRKKYREEPQTKVTADAVMEAGLGPVTFADISKMEPFDGKWKMSFIGYQQDAESMVALTNKLIEAGAGEFNEQDYLADYYNVTEQILAGYAMGTIEFPWGNLVAGARAEYIKNDGEAYGTVDDGDFELFNSGSDHFGVYPSAHLNWDITQDQKFRLSLNSGVARAGFEDRAPNFSISDMDEVIGGGNPFIKPERTYGVDVYYEYYLAPVGILSVGAFYKKVQDPIIGLTTIFGSKTFDNDEYTRSEYAFETNGNGNGGYYYGLELAYAQKFDFLPDWGLPEWTSGFGVNTNLTLADSEIELSNGRKAKMSGTSDLTYNASMYWEGEGLSLRVNWQYRSKWMNSYNLDHPELDRYWDSIGRLSLGARYQINENIEWFLNANNLNNEVGKRFRGTRDRTYEIEGFGRSYTTGIRLNF
ncbi:TonB-dependent receptor [Altericroceibacterium endophyticum]|uniref:TonB-dependent receptor n=1 Tax=Altericroceibacterium endophyticum TaxID=1808508 RepID=A0A6I4T2P2_9SPHN|nr:TonB-dependent receptor [Altericroceibacterium endophyticum]MXO65217.1 TonB-dependent receptor [Altericroceibacterium endophyticum]